MTCHSSDSTESIENERRSQTETQVTESEQSRIATAMRDLKNTGKRLLLVSIFSSFVPVTLTGFMLETQPQAVIYIHKK